MIPFIIVATAIFAFLFTIWKNGDVLNSSLKLSFLVMVVWGVVFLVKQFAS